MSGIILASMKQPGCKIIFSNYVYTVKFTCYYKCVTIQSLVHMQVMLRAHLISRGNNLISLISLLFLFIKFGVGLVYLKVVRKRTQPGNSLQATRARCFLPQPK